MDNDQLEIPTSTTAQTAKMATEIKREWDHLTELDIDECLTSAGDTEHKGQSSQRRKQQKNNGNNSVSMCYLALSTKLATRQLQETVEIFVLFACCLQSEEK